MQEYTPVIQQIIDKIPTNWLLFFILFFFAQKAFKNNQKLITKMLFKTSSNDKIAHIEARLNNNQARFDRIEAGIREIKEIIGGGDCDADL